MSFLVRMLVLLFVVGLPLEANAHEVRPALLHLQETEHNQFDMLWRVPARGERALPIEPDLTQACESQDLVERYFDGLRLEERNQIICTEGLAGVWIGIKGLSRIKTDVLVTVSYLNGGTETLRATPQNPGVTLVGQQSRIQVAATYFWLGTEHILLGIDHLLFVTALLFLVSGWGRLLSTITAFTVAHSITLAGAAVGAVSAPSALVEVLIALSIVVMAAEIIKANSGENGIAIRQPWVIAFGFGLLHGFGFAGALRDIGLPSEAIPAALLAFNVGVEAGQILFIAALALLAFLARFILPASEKFAKRAVPIGIGVVAGFWVVERTVAIWS